MVPIFAQVLYPDWSQALEEVLLPCWFFLEEASWAFDFECAQALYELDLKLTTDVSKENSQLDGAEIAKLPN